MPCDVEPLTSLVSDPLIVWLVQVNDCVQDHRDRARPPSVIRPNHTGFVSGTSLTRHGIQLVSCHMHRAGSDLFRAGSDMHLCG